MANLQQAPPEVPFGSWSLAAAAAAILLVLDFHPLLLAALRAGETAAWLAILLAGLMAAAFYWPAAAALRALPGGNLIGLARAAAGAPGAVATGLLVCGLLVYDCGFILRQTAEMTVGSLYPHTPQTFAMVALALCALYGALGGMAALVRLGRLFLPGLILAILFVLTAALGWGEMRFLLPFWGPGPGPLLRGSFWLSALYAPVALFLLLAAGCLRDRPRLGRAGLAALGGSGLLFAATKAVLVMTYPLPLGRSVTFPLHEMSRLITGGRFFERIEGLWLMYWFFGTAAHLAALLGAAALAYAGAFGMPSHRPVVPALVALTATVALFPPDQGRAIVWQALAAPYGLAIGFGLPLALALLAAVRRRPGAHGA